MKARSETERKENKRPDKPDTQDQSCSVKRNLATCVRRPPPSIPESKANRRPESIPRLRQEKQDRRTASGGKEIGS